MQKFNATNVVLNSIRLATPCKSGVGGWVESLRQFRKVLRRKTAICPGFAKKKAKLSRFAKKNAKISRFRGVLVERRWRSLNGLGCEEMQKFNATNVVLNSIRLATPCESGGWGGWKFAKFRKVLRRKTAICPEFAKKKAKLSRLCEEKRQNVPVLRCSSCSVLLIHGFSQKQRFGVENHRIATPLHCNASYT